MKDVVIVSATRDDVTNFRHSPLGISLERLQFDKHISARIKFGNTGPSRVGLSAIYNTFLVPQFPSAILAFVHADVYIEDYFLSERLNDAIKVFNVIGIAGNKNPDFSQPSWGLKWNPDGSSGGWQEFKNLSGAVAHGSHPMGDVSPFGETPAACELLDGLFLAVDTEKVLHAGARFDPQFEFHFYDLDFCRTCRQKNVTVGTWPIAVTHRSTGGYDSPEWHAARPKYELKWK